MAGGGEPALFEDEGKVTGDRGSKQVLDVKYILRDTENVSLHTQQNCPKSSAGTLSRWWEGGQGIRIHTLVFHENSHANGLTLPVCGRLWPKIRQSGWWRAGLWVRLQDVNIHVVHYECGSVHRQLEADAP